MITRRVFDVQRRIVAHKTVEAWDTAPHVSILLELDVTALMGSLADISARAEFAGTRVTINSVMLKIIAAGLKKSPEMNAHVQYSRRTGVGEVMLHDEINIATPFKAACGRMITPVIKGVERMTLLGVCRGMEELKRRVANTHLDILLLEAAHDDTWKRIRKGQLWAVFRRVWANYIGRDRVILPSRQVAAAYYQTPAADRITAADLLSATILVSNIGSAMRDLPGCFGLLEIIQPQTVAIGLAAVQKKPLVVTDESGQENIAVRQVLPMTICFDHRAMDFEAITGFIREVNRLCREGLAPEARALAADVVTPSLAL
jgi:pyruvate/2-oxoglutarate dehydrogenase complex dihydrolipoamide acyltransferase (E2) component